MFDIIEIECNFFIIVSAAKRWWDKKRLLPGKIQSQKNIRAREFCVKWSELMNVSQMRMKTNYFD